MLGSVKPGLKVGEERQDIDISLWLIVSHGLCITGLQRSNLERGEG
jgi:hypothetical protein